jgi:hypothetical protein
MMAFSAGTGSTGGFGLPGRSTGVTLTGIGMARIITIKRLPNAYRYAVRKGLVALAQCSANISRETFCGRHKKGALRSLATPLLDYS